MAEPTQTTNGSRLWLVAAVGVAVAAVGVAFREIGDWDSWWQLLIGRVAIETGTTLPVDDFSYSVAGAAWHHKDLAGYVVLQLGYLFGGFGGVSFVRFVVACGAAVGLALTAPQTRRSPLIWAIAAAAMLGANEFRFVPRALIFSELGFVGLLALIERLREQIALRPERAPWRTLAATALWMVAWTNLHRGALLGFVVLGGFVGALVLARLGATVTQRRFAATPARLALLGPVASWTTIGAVGATTVGAVAGGCLNASGVAVYTTGLAVSYDPIHRNFISEWHPVTLDLALHDFAPLTVLLVVGWVIAIGSITTGLARRRAGAVDIWHVGVLAVMTTQGLSSLRWLTFASTSAAVVTYRVLSDVVSRRQQRSVAMMMAVMVAAVALPVVHNGRHWGAGPVPDRYPDGALAFAQTHNLGANVHNAFVFGGYVAWAQWPDRRVLIDGRNDMVYPSEFYLRCIEAQSDSAVFAGLQHEYPTDWVLAENSAGRESFVFLEDDPAWMAVYWSESSIVWVRREAHADLATQEFRVLDARNPVASMMAAVGHSEPGSELDGQIRAELQRFAQASPESVRANALLVLYFDARGDRVRRDVAMENLERIAPDSDVVTQLRAGLRR